ncbi:unnamed protein product [Prorocentrum cordatum]|uniref:Vacuolar protein sorting-associated protein 51 homolog n=1 Tax=Prorocentrum cordatum TaxID=2364126 RepID=A0ABN9X9P8_9DINO|nr:unnamed protein product [Polarella glacialis]
MPRLQAPPPIGAQAPSGRRLEPDPPRAVAARKRGTMAEPPGAPGAPAAAPQRRRVGAMLSAYYGIDVTGGAAAQASARPAKPIDREGFDAKQHFESVVSTGLVVDVVKQANELDEEVRDLDGDNQMVAYENYSKFIRETDVIKQIKTSMDELKPDLGRLEQSFEKIIAGQRKVDAGVSGRAHEIEALLKQQALFSKLKVLMDLPTTLAKCLEKESYSNACRAYSCCAPFLRQHKGIPAFQRIIEDVEHQMSRIRSALRARLKSPSTPVDEAVNGSLTLLDLGEDYAKITREFLQGRTATLQGVLSESSAPAADSGKPGAVLQSASTAAAERYLPVIRDTIVGMRKIQGTLPASEVEAADGSALPDFVAARLEDLSDRIGRHAEKRDVPVDTLVECMQVLRASLGQLEPLMPELVARLTHELLAHQAGLGIGGLFSAAVVAAAAELGRLRCECQRLEESKSRSVDGLLEEVGSAERALASGVQQAVQLCQPLLSATALIKPQDGRAAKQLVSTLDRQLSDLCSALAEACRACAAGGAADPVRRPELEALAKLDRAGGLFSLALLALGRRLEEKVFGGAWAKARDLCADLDSTAAELAPCPALLAATRSASEAAMARYVATCAERLGGILRDAMKGRDWKSSWELDGPSLVLEMVFKEKSTPATCSSGACWRTAEAAGSRPPGGSTTATGPRRGGAGDAVGEETAGVPSGATPPETGAVAGILQLAFGTLDECVRGETFGRSGLQQVQVDCEMLADISRDFVEEWEDASVLENALREVMELAKKNCSDPVLMETSVVEQLCDRKKKAWRVD